MTTETSGERKRVVILGATGSSGESALNVARDIPERMEVVGLATNSNAEKLAAAANATPAQSDCLDDETKFDAIQRGLAYTPWNMGPKINIDSATLFNKGLEMIEAHWLFGVEMKRVEVVIHPQSIVHSMVEFADGSTLAQLSYSNMCFPIQYAVTWPDRVPNSLPPLDFSKLSRLEFFTPRYDDFPALNLARQAGETGGTLPAVMNAANEVAVAGFLNRQVRFPDIWQIVEEVMNRHTSVAHPDLDAILQADQWARAEATRCVETLKR